MTTEQYYAAIDLGSSQITGVVAKKTEIGKIEIIACEQVESACIRRGEVKNTQDTAFQIVEIVKKLENNKALRENKLEIKKMYVGLGGHTLKTQTNYVKRILDTEEDIDESLIEDMYNEIRKKRIENSEVYEVIEQEYLVDDEWEFNPIGMNCGNLQGLYQLIYGKPELRRNLMRSFEKAKQMEIAGLYIAPMATAEAALTETDKEMGCALIDFGADTTSICVYYNGYLRHVAVIPFGGNVITTDIKDLNITKGEAEALKVEFGNAMETLEKDQTVVLPEQNGKSVSTTFLASIIEARTSEIMDIVWREIEKSKFAGKLGSGIVITGRGAQLRNIDELIRFKTGCNVRHASHNRHIDENSDSKYNNIINAHIIGLLLLAKDSCVQIKDETPAPKEEKGGKGNQGGKSTQDGTTNVRKGLFNKITKGLEKGFESLFDVDGEAKM